MSDYSGFAPLEKPDDLIKKMKYDLNRMRSEPSNSYAAFDFFVTTEHMLDWLFPKDPNQRREMRKQNYILQIISHIANGAKHFEATSSHHTSVNDLKFSRGGFSSNSFSSDAFDPSSFQFSGLTVKLSDGQSKLAIDLADEAYEFWCRYLSSHS
ncbi:hypothetical protein Mal35_36410 [Gimesia maris]|uniref:hypothetical protein n=1 Tax=Gimesia maris TaxID=122 RepID=UPI00118A29C7|nr:hypothetical protein [Gimesia maris]QDT80170.1 hypothetical protein Mal35_36410 [Gimesia maris]